jgi:hypothetical protein
MRWFLVKLFMRVMGFGFVNVQEDAVFLAKDERSLNCAARDYVDLLDKGGEEIEL